MCAMCGDRRVLVDDAGQRRPCPFHTGTRLVNADSAAVEALRAALFLDMSRQHQIAPAGFIGPVAPLPDRPPAPKSHPGWRLLGAFLIILSAAAVLYGIVGVIL